MLKTLFTAGLISDIVSNNFAKTESNKNIDKLLSSDVERSIIASCKGSSLELISISALRNGNFSYYGSNIMQISKNKIGDYNSPIHCIERAPKDLNLDNVTITPNPACYHRTFKNSLFCALKLMEIEDFKKHNSLYKLVKIYMNPIEITRKDKNDITVYICEVIKKN